MHCNDKYKAENLSGIPYLSSSNRSRHICFSLTNYQNGTHLPDNHLVIKVQVVLLQTSKYSMLSSLFKNANLIHNDNAINFLEILTDQFIVFIFLFVLIFFHLFCFINFVVFYYFYYYYHYYYYYYYYHNCGF